MDLLKEHGNRVVAVRGFDVHYVVKLGLGKGQIISISLDELEAFVVIPLSAERNAVGG